MAIVAAVGANVGNRSSGSGRRVIGFAGRERVERERCLGGRGKGAIWQVMLNTFLEIAIFIGGRLTGRFLLISRVDWRSLGGTVALEVWCRARRVAEALAVF